MKKVNIWRALLVLCLIMTLGACGKTETETEGEQTKVVVSKTNTNGYYRVALSTIDGESQFTPSPSRGLLTRYLASRQDVEAVEQGLAHLSMTPFSPSTYYFQDGSYLTYDTLIEWLSPKLTASELARAVENDANFVDHGLNPSSEEKVMTAEGVEITPDYIAHILEQTYVTIDANNVAQLGGVSIAISMTGCQYYTSSEGYDRYHCYDDSVLKEQATKAADAIATYLRQEYGLTVPILFGVYKQAAATSSVPGQYIATTMLEGTSTSVSSWQDVQQQTYLLPSSEASASLPEIANTFTSFQTQIANYFPGNVGVIGYTTVWSGQVERLYVEVNVSSRSYMEIVGLTQFLESSINERYDFNTDLEIVIKDGQATKAVIEKQYDQVARVNIING